MRVVELTAYHIRIPLKRAVKHASHTRTDTDNVVIKCVLSDRSQGFGEGLPRDYVTGETIDSVFDLLKRSDLAAQMESCRDFAAALVLAERFQLAPVPGDARHCAGNAARCAVELAMLDAFGHAFGEPLSLVAQRLAPELYQPRDRVQYSGIIASSKGRRVGAYVAVMRIYGFRQI